MKNKFYKISGYWKDNKRNFSDYLVTDTEEVDEATDDQIFFYGMTKKVIEKAISDGADSIFEFVITSYEEVVDYLETLVEELVEGGITEIFDAVHNQVSTKSGDITPCQTERLEKIQKQLVELIVEQVNQNL